ncbi:hypothetical protein AALP_AA2G140700 [Arabis alpina]|uniref:Hydroxyproline-rich glycoprotein family protein n=1 Tax=Arabis alpina TaxID=50452 RepID=A0A087HHC1_ARAAL|nr:hypothetical protein AALP_AA2G140700 [Arabis alpina]
MAMSKLHFSSLVFLFSLVNLPFITISETPCPYPCYPPPTGGGSTQQTGNNYPQPTGYYPPPTGYYTPPTSGNVPNYPSPPFTGGNSGGGYYGPPPPDPILPYFPFYYRKPPHQTDQPSFAVKPTVRIVTVTTFLVVVALLLGNVLLMS